MRRFFCSFFSVLLLISLCSCNNNLSNSNGQNVKYNHTVCTKNNIDEFLTIAENMEGDGLFKGINISSDNLYNVTPAEISTQTDYKIFKTSDSCASFILIDGEIHLLCAYFGGYGFVNAVPCDFDEDGITDLIVASSWGSGMHRSLISIFNAKTKESTILYDTSDTETPDADLVVMARTPSFSSKDPTELPIYYNVYSVEIIVMDGNLADLYYLPADVIGSVICENGEVIFKPTDK